MHLLSYRDLALQPARTMIYQLEDLIVELCDADLILPHARSYSRFTSDHQNLLSRGYKKVVRRSIGSFKREEPELSSDGPNILMLVALNGKDLHMLNTIKDWRSKFDYVFAYLFDAWVLEAIPSIANQLDHIIVPYAEAVPSVSQRCQVKVSALPAGHDILGQGGYGGQRDIDVISYGRSCDLYLQALAETATGNQPISLYDHPGFAVEKLPKKTFTPGRTDWDDKSTLISKLQRSKLALAFENFHTSNVRPGAHIADRLQHSILTQRWFECLGSGCVVVGKRPRSTLTKPYLDWPNSTIELPDDPGAGVEMIREMLSDTTFLNDQGRRNYFESMKRNDWRVRLREIFRLSSIEEPAGLTASIDQIEALYARYGRSARGADSY